MAPGLREAKKQRTRKALIEAALLLFDEHGYEATTTAAIAAAAGVSPATFFNYFAGKEDVVFADQHLYDEILAGAFAAAPADEPVADLVFRTLGALATADAWSFPLDHPLTAVRTRLIASVPALRAGFLLRNAFVADSWARLLREARPELGEIEAATITGAVIGGLQAALQANVDEHGRARRPEPEVVAEALRLVVHGFGQNA
ncbi:TetR/AcrR family transcriptional regulator [Amycolatopsis eburnea]|uniref:TetR family transcriptional regulator n=1 Tax=Amycolatopsis eburnea TaxID=2267691 RepID=A0A427T724_9PSEU|nr:TetR/AcrR family transcriptional regulator [Amycolatopsis eburnea]RSD15491.1 TetR family transcriptional regulator [Amycolatopsis eburnea]